ncbi:hypothetical protein [uncultured Nostoc sp.]
MTILSKVIFFDGNQTHRDRQIIATIVNESDYPHECQPDDLIK